VLFFNAFELGGGSGNQVISSDEASSSSFDLRIESKSNFFLFSRGVFHTFLEWELIFNSIFLHINDGINSSNKRSSQNIRTSDCWLMAPENSWCLVECPAHWEPQEEGVMNIAARFSLS
jgi:hypothetical protein